MKGVFMFSVGDLVVYGSDGVLEVEKIGPISMSGISKDDMYYTLCNPQDKKGCIFASIDNADASIRPILTKDEALKLIDSIDSIKCLNIPPERKKEEVLKEAFRKYDCRVLVQIIKALKELIDERVAEGKKIPAGDEKYYQMAQERLVNELAFSLQMEKSEVRDIVFKHVCA